MRMETKEMKSYYKILGTTANIGNSRIKEKYIQAVKEHPPEIDPEGFESVRKAYETLRDPEKRKQYDLMRKYGGNVEGLMKKAHIAMENENFQKASQLLEIIAAIDSDRPNVLTNLMIMSAQMEDIESMDSFFGKALKSLSETDLEEIIELHFLKVEILIDNEYYDEALKTLEQGEELYPEISPHLKSTYAVLCMQMDREEEAWEEINAAIPLLKDGIFNNIYVLLTWINIMLDLNKWELSSKIKATFKRCIKHLTEGEKEAASELLFEEFEKSNEAGSFRAAELFIDILKLLPGKFDSVIKEKYAEVKEHARVQKEIDRLSRDQSAFPLLFINAMEWFYEGNMHKEQLQMILDGVPGYVKEQLKEEEPDYAAGIVYLSKKYPALYKYFKKKWKNLFAELTEGLNREMRREIGKLR